MCRGDAGECCRFGIYFVLMFLESLSGGRLGTGFKSRTALLRHIHRRGCDLCIDPPPPSPRFVPPPLDAERTQGRTLQSSRLWCNTTTRRCISLRQVRPGPRCVCVFHDTGGVMAELSRRHQSAANNAKLPPPRYPPRDGFLLKIFSLRASAFWQPWAPENSQVRPLFFYQPTTQSINRCRHSVSLAASLFLRSPTLLRCFCFFSRASGANNGGYEAVAGSHRDAEGDRSPGAHGE